MRRCSTFLSALVVVWFSSVDFTPLHAAQVLIFAAASLTDALKEAAGTYEKMTGDKIVFNFGASGTLERQIEDGAPADIFFSADESIMNSLERRELIRKDTRKSRLANCLVIITPKDSTIKINSPAELTDSRVKRIALGDPKVVPAGMYSKTYLKKQDLWNAVEPKMVLCENVREALNMVNSEDVDAGMVFKTDALINSKRVKINFEIPCQDTPEVSYPAAICRDSKQVEAATKFLQYLDSDEMAKLFERYGFVVLR